MAAPCGYVSLYEACLHPHAGMQHQCVHGEINCTDYTKNKGYCPARYRYYTEKRTDKCPLCGSDEH